MDPRFEESFKIGRTLFKLAPFDCSCHVFVRRSGRVCSFYSHLCMFWVFQSYWNARNLYELGNFFFHICCTCCRQTCLLLHIMIINMNVDWFVRFVHFDTKPQQYVSQCSFANLAVDWSYMQWHRSMVGQLVSLDEFITFNAYWL